MSLFQTREWWCNQQDAEEECGQGCLCVANIDNAKDGNGKGFAHFTSLLVDLGLLFTLLSL